MITDSPRATQHIGVGPPGWNGSPDAPASSQFASEGLPSPLRWAQQAEFTNGSRAGISPRAKESSVGVGSAVEKEAGEWGGNAGM